MFLTVAGLFVPNTTCGAKWKAIKSIIKKVVIISFLEKVHEKVG
jgi:hypothetical protein